MSEARLRTVFCTCGGLFGALVLRRLRACDRLEICAVVRSTRVLDPKFGFLRGAAAQVRRLNRFDIDHVVVEHERQRRLLVKVTPLPPHMLMLLGALRRRLRSPLTVFLAAGYALLGLLQPGSALR